MPLDQVQLGIRIANARHNAHISQDRLSDILNVSRNHVSQIELAMKMPSIDMLIDIANALHVSADDLLVDSLEYSVSTADSEIHQLLLDCNDKETEIIVNNAKNLKALLSGQGI